MTRLTRAKTETEVEELKRLHKGRTYYVEADSQGRIIILDSNDAAVIAFGVSKGLD